MLTKIPNKTQEFFDVGERGSTVNLSSYKVMKLPSKSSDLVSLSNLENEFSKDSGLSCGILNQMIENIEIPFNQVPSSFGISIYPFPFWSSIINGNVYIVSLLYECSSVKSQSLVTNILCSDIENFASSPFESCLGLKITSKSFLRNCNNSFLTFSSRRNLSFLSFDINDDIIPSFNKASCILQRSFDVLFCEGHQKIIKDFFYRYSCFEQFKNLPDHDSCALESRLSMADFTVCNNILVNFDSHCKNRDDNEIFKLSDYESLSDFNLVKINEIYDVKVFETTLSMAKDRSMFF